MSNFDYWDIQTGEPLTDSELHERYDDMLDEVYGEFMNLLASRILKETDPIAYRVGFSDWLDAETGETITDEEPTDDEEDGEDA
jgi:hypothetical protein